MPLLYSTPHICILRCPPPPPLLRNLLSLCLTPLHPRCSPRHLGAYARFPFCFPRGAWVEGEAQRHLDVSILWVFDCTQPTAFPLTSPWTGPDVYEPWPADPPPHPRYTLLHIVYNGLCCLQWWWRLLLFYLWGPEWVQASIKCHALCRRCGMHNMIRWCCGSVHPLQVNTLTFWNQRCQNLNAQTAKKLTYNTFHIS